MEKIFEKQIVRLDFTEKSYDRVIFGKLVREVSGNQALSYEKNVKKHECYPND